MTVFELMAVLGLDTSEFDSKLTAAEDGVQDVIDKSEDLTNPKLGGTKQTVLQPMIEDAKTVDGKLLELRSKSKETSEIMEGFADVTADVVKATIEGIIEFGKQSIEAAAATGSEMANAYNQSVSDLEMSLDILKVKTGESLFPFATAWNNFVESLTGVSRLDKIELMASKLQELSEINLEKVRKQVEDTFDIFEEVGEIKPGNVSDYQSGLESQTEYWTKYADTLNSLKEKGVDPAFLAEIADGSKESMEKLAALDKADTAGLENLLAAYNNMKAAQDEAAASMNAAKLAVDENAKAIADSMTVLMVDTGTEIGGTLAGYLANTSVSELSSAYPAIESMVNQINAKLAELGYGENAMQLPGLRGEEGEEGETPVLDLEVSLSAAEDSEGDLQADIDAMSMDGDVLLYANPTSGSKLQSYLDGLNLTATVKLTPSFSFGEFPGRAVGLDYVPHDEYVARLHEGEAVLTKLEADRWRRGEGAAEAKGSAMPNITINITGDVRDPYAAADEIKNALELMRWQG